MILRDTVVEVDLRAIGANMDAICQMVGPDVAVMPVVKANAYGLGAVGVAPTLMEHGARYLAVATLSEAMELREAYADYPLFIRPYAGQAPWHSCRKQHNADRIFKASGQDTGQGRAGVGQKGKGSPEGGYGVPSPWHRRR